MSMEITYVVDTETSTVELSVDTAGPTTIWRTSYYEQPDGTMEPSNSVIVRGAYLEDGGADSRLDVFDYECPVGVTVTYRCVYGNTSSPDDGDAIGPDTPEIIIESTNTWLVDLWDARNSHKAWIESFDTMEYDIDSDAVYPLLRRTPIVNGNVRRAMAGSFSILTETANDARKIRNLLANGLPILFQSPSEYDVGNCYMTIEKLTEQRLNMRGEEHMRRFILEYKEVDRPKPEWVVNLDNMNNINFADMLLIWGWFENVNNRAEDFEAVRTTKKGSIGDAPAEDGIAGPIRPPDLTPRD